MEGSRKDWRTLTVSVRNLNICWARRPGLDISNGDKEIILERSSRGRKFFNVVKSESRNVPFPCRRGYDTFIALSCLGTESDGCALIGSARGQNSGSAKFIVSRTVMPARV